jgi:acyl-CoA synthetase (AMP-forming)/AMP-acid ligase II
MTWTLPASVMMRTEGHFGDRLVRSFADRPASVPEAFARACAARPDAEALVCGEERLTYARLGERSAQVAAGLAARGIKAQDRVGVMLGNRVEFATSVLGILRLGAIAVPINTRLQRPEVAYILGQCRARALVHESNLASRVPARSEAPTVEHILDERQGDGGRRRCRPSKRAPPSFCTSGTGAAEGVLTHFNIVHSLLHYKYCFALRA